MCVLSKGAALSSDSGPFRHLQSLETLSTKKQPGRLIGAEAGQDFLNVGDQSLLPGLQGQTN